MERQQLRSFGVVLVWLVGSTIGASLGIGQMGSEPALAAQPSDLRASLVSLDDLPKGWTPIMTSTVEDLLQSEAGLCGTGAVIDGHIVEEVDAAFQWTGHSLYLGHDVVRFAPGQAATGLAGLRAQLEPLLPCEWQEAGARGTTVQWQASLLPLPALGEESFGLSLIFTAGDERGHADLVAIRRGDILGILVFLAVEPDADTVDPNLFAEVAARVDARLARLGP